MRQTLFLNVVVFGFFVFLFSSVYRRRRSERLKLWIAAWLCAVVHFMAQLLRPASEAGGNLVAFFEIGALMLCGICFILSFPDLDVFQRRRIAALGLAIPSLALTACAVLDVQPPAILLSIEVLGQVLALVFLWRFTRDRLTITIPGTALIFVCSQWSSYELLIGQPSRALAVILMELFAFYAVLFAHDFPRRSAGIWTTIAGLLSWAAVFPVGMLLEERWPSVAINPEIWNVPKVVVAFGMLVTLFEEELILAATEREQYRNLFDGNPLPMWIFDKESTQLLEGNAAAVRDFGWSREELGRLTIGDLLSEKEASPVGLVELNWRLAGDASSTPVLHTATHLDQAHAHAMRFQTRKGAEVVVEVTLQRVSFQGREARLLVAKDITAQVEAHEQLIHLANHDPLTGLPNRLLLHDRMKSALATAMRHGTKAAIVCVDLDRFKQVNDTFGHAAGDSCLKEVAHRFRQRLRSVDTAARTGGEEFMIILDDVGTLRDAEKVVNDLLFALSAPHIVDGRKIHLTASIGIALFPDDGTDPAELWSMADAAMYRAKQSGGNQHTFFSRAI
jgi:diguanylate cyclase (GGDEF)-like protein